MNKVRKIGNKKGSWKKKKKNERMNYSLMNKIKELEIIGQKIEFFFFVDGGGALFLFFEFLHLIIYIFFVIL